MYIKRTYYFFPDKISDNKEALLRFRVKWNKNIVAFNVGFKVEVDKWSTDTQRCKKNTSHGDRKIPAQIINTEIERYFSVADAVFRNFEVNEKIPTREEFRNSFNIKVGKKSEDPIRNVIFYLDRFMIEMDKQWKYTTVQSFKTLKKQLQAYKENITFNELSIEEIKNFVCYLQKQELRNVTIKKYVKLLKWFLNWATHKGYNKNTDYTGYNPKFRVSNKTIIFLEWDEIMKILEYKFNNENRHLEKVRDMFCFCCFTSLRYSDLFNLKWSDIYDNYILITSIKTSDSLKIDLNDYSREILKKYRDKNYYNNAVFPVISNQKMNEYIKEIGELCGINKLVRITYYKENVRYDEVYPKYALLSTHAGRRTFISNALMMGIPVHIVMKWTGLDDYKTMKPYIEMADKEKENAMSLFNRKIPKD